MYGLDTIDRLLLYFAIGENGPASYPGRGTIRFAEIKL